MDGLDARRAGRRSGPLLTRMAGARADRGAAMSETGDLESGCLPRRPETAGVALLRGDPKTAIIRLSAPMIAAMLLHVVLQRGQRDLGRGARGGRHGRRSGSSCRSS